MHEVMNSVFLKLTCGIKILSKMAITCITLYSSIANKNSEAIVASFGNIRILVWFLFMLDLHLKPYISLLHH